ncbi:MAG: hypothetical protein ACRCVT_09490 [Leadbetterella sp.]
MIFTNFGHILLSSAANLAFVSNLCLISSLLAITFIGFVFANRQYSNKVDEKTEQIKQICHTYITEVLFGGHQYFDDIEYHNYIFSSKFRKQILIGEMVRLHDNLCGNEAKILEDYYVSSQLIKVSFSKIYSSNKDLVINGLTELVEFKSKHYVRILEKLLSETVDTELKNYLLTSILKLDPEKGLNLIIQTQHFLSDWFQLIILKELEELQFSTIPKLEVWLENSNESVRILGERLYAIYKPIMTLGFRDIEEREEELLTNFSTEVHELNEIERALAEIYDHESEEIKEEIINTLTLLKSKIRLPLQEDRIKKYKERPLTERILLEFKSASKLKILKRRLYYLWKYRP